MPLAPLALALAVLGWSDITLQPSRGDQSTSSFLRSVAGIDRPSERTVETLKRFDLEDRYRRDVDGVLAVLERAARAQPEAELVYALAELSWIEGLRLDRRKKPAALDRFLDAVGYAYDYLFDPELAAGRRPSDPRFRLACDLYNGGLDRLIRAAQAKGKLGPDDTIKLKVNGREQLLRVALWEPWAPGQIDQLILASDYEVTGLATRSYQYGLGVPLIGIRKSGPETEGVERFYPPEMAFPFTAVLRPNSRLRDPMVPIEDARECTLDLLDPIRYQTVGNGPGAIALESDFTTPLAYTWSKTDLSKFRWTGLLRPGEVGERAGLMLLRPYEPGKIPVVMVHGLASSPLAWIPMLNELLRHPKIHQNFQFFLYLYPTGTPIPIAAAGLRDWLYQAEKEFAPGGSDPAFRRMVMLGHSMGGLLSHLMSVKSEDKFWDLCSDRSFEEILGPPETLDELKRYMYFEPVPFVSRVVFLATPHRGSEMSRGVVGRVSAGLISDPDHINKLLSRLIRDNPNAFDSRQFRRMPTSIETLASNDPVLLSLLEMPPAQDVSFHSIIGVNRPGPVANSTDGVVSYASAHLDGVVSEKRVRSDHGVQRDAEAILEVRRILLQHLDETRPVAAGTLPGMLQTQAHR